MFTVLALFVVSTVGCTGPSSLYITLMMFKFKVPKYMVLDCETNFRFQWVCVWEKSIWSVASKVKEKSGEKQKAKHFIFLKEWPEG